MKRLKRLLNIIINILFYACLLALLWVLLQIFCFTSFRIPSDSMEPELIPGDNILVNKLSKGARLFDVFASLEKEEVNIYRMPGFGSFKRNDVLVFNFPYPAQWDSIGFDVMKYYVKRCIALPGDTLEINNGFFKIRGLDVELGNTDSQKLLSSLPDTVSSGIVMGTYPHNERMGWTIKNFGPLVVPSEGYEVEMSIDVWLLYRQLIFWEQKKRLNMDGNSFFLGDSVISSYRFNDNYYFMAGDKLTNSQDSRYWGLLPENLIVGRADYVLYSKDSFNGKIRWNRIMKRIK